MDKRSLMNENLFVIMDNEETFYGCDQEWYTTDWQRRAGCGPTVVTNILHYLNRRRSASQKENLPLSKREALLLMEEVYQYVTPTPQGIPSTKLLTDFVLNYAKAMNLNLKLGVFNIPGNPELRPQFHELISFLDKALSEDTPIAFLNLDNGAEKRLDSWHWVTIISLEYASDGSSALIGILDGGTIKKVDLVKWFKTTSLGGGLVSFDYE